MEKGFLGFQDLQYLAYFTQLGVEPCFQDPCCALSLHDKRTRVYERQVVSPGLVYLLFSVPA